MPDEMDECTEVAYGLPIDGDPHDVGIWEADGEQEECN